MAKTTVVNIKDAPRNWAINAQYAYIGRAGHGQNGYFGNPVVIGKPCPECGKIHEKAGDTLPCYTLYFARRMNNDKLFCERVQHLRGRTLVCFCKPGPCHGDVIVAYLEA